MPTITAIEGVGEVSAVKLRAAGVRTTEALLERGCTPRQHTPRLEQSKGWNTKSQVCSIRRFQMTRTIGDHS